MKRAVLLLVAACQAGGVDDYPIGPGGGGPSGQGPGGGGDAGVGDGGDGDGGVPLVGKVCLLRDLRNLTLCNDAEAKGLIVTLGTRTASTTDNGVFTIAAPRGSGFTWHVTSTVRDQLITSVMAFGTDNTIPAIRSVDYRALVSSNTVPIGDQEGSIVVRVVNGPTPVANVIAGTVDPDRPVLYAGDDAEIWDPTQTLTDARFGVVWFPGVSLTLSPATITLTPQSSTSVTTTATVENQAITFVTRDLQ